MHILVTGGAGFIGSNFLRYWLTEHPADKVTNLDALTYAGNLASLRDIEHNQNYTFVHGNIGDYELVRQTCHDVDIIVNFAAESHNDRAIIDPGIFVKTNVLGTQILLAAARDAGVKRFHHISTCEVFGELELNETRSFKETDAYAPKTPYNASKAAANHIVMAYFHTFKFPITISHCANNYGPYQFPEKIIPLFTVNALRNLPLPLFKSSHNQREWIHVFDHVRAIDMILQHGKIGEAYNIGTRVEKSIEEIADAILSALDKPVSLKSYVPDRLQHDQRYLLDPSKLQKAIAWQPERDFTTGLQDTVAWYQQNEAWWQPLLSH